MDDQSRQRMQDYVDNILAVGEDSHSQVRLAQYLIQIEVYENAIDILDAILEKEPHYLPARTARGQAYVQCDKLQNALADYDDVLSRDPQDVLALTCRAQVHILMRRYEDALVDLDHAIAIRSDYVGAFALRGQAHLRLDRPQQALADLDRAIAIDPEYQPSYVTRAALYRQLSKDDEALADLQTALPLNPNDDWTHYQMALIALARGEDGAVNLSQAIEIVHRAPHRLRDQARPNFNAAVYHLAAGQGEPALHDAATALSHAQPYHIHEALEDLQALRPLLPDTSALDQIHDLLQSAL